MSSVSCGSWDLYSYSMQIYSCGIQTLSCGMQDLVSWPEIKPGSSALRVRILATGPPGKSPNGPLWFYLVLFHNLSLNDLFLSLLLVPVHPLVLCGCHCCYLPNNFTSVPIGYMIGLYSHPPEVECGHVFYFGQEKMNWCDFCVQALRVCTWFATLTSAWHGWWSLKHMSRSSFFCQCGSLRD